MGIEFKLKSKKMVEALAKLKEAFGNESLWQEDSKHSRFQENRKDYKTVLIDNVSFLITCDANGKLVFKKNHSIIIEDGIIKDVLPAESIKNKNFDLVYDAGKRGGTVVTPGLINAHSHIHMYLLRSAMMLDEEKNVDETISNMAEWQKFETEDSHLFASVGDLTEQQKNGITTTLTQGPSFLAAEAAARITQHNLINAVSAVSNSRPNNSPEMVEKLLEQKEEFFSTPAVALHYLYKTPLKSLKKVREIIKKHDALLTFHMAESPGVVENTLRKHRKSEVEILKKFELLNSRSIASHAIYLKPKEIEEMAESQIGVVHLPTSNLIHKSGTFPFWPFNDANGYKNIALGTDSVVSKSRLDLLTEAHQARITHQYLRMIKYGTLFKMMTINGAKILHMSDRGCIIPGMKADMVFWKLRDRGFIPYDENNPATIVGNLITHGGRFVRDLMINGKFIIKSRRHILIDETKLLDILQKEHMKIRERKENNGH